MPHTTERLTIVDETGELVLSMTLCAMQRNAEKAGALHKDVTLGGCIVRFESVLCYCAEENQYYRSAAGAAAAEKAFGPYEVPKKA